MNKINIMYAVRDERQARLTHYYNGNIWFEVDQPEGTATFPVPVSDTGSGYFSTMKALLLMRWMRKFNDSIDESLAGSSFEETDNPFVEG